VAKLEIFSTYKLCW